MADTWPEVLLGDVAAEITVGHVGPMATRYVPTGTPFLRSQNVRRLRLDLTDVKFIPPDFHAQLAKSRLRPGDVVIVRTGEPGACAVVPDELIDANCSDLVIVRPGEKLDARFLAYYVNEAAAHHVASHLVGAVQQHFNVGAARTLPMRLPPIEEQIEIAAVLGSLDDKIEQNRRTGSKLEGLARGVFKAWFVDFEPVKAKAAGATAFPGMPPETFATLPTRLTNSDLGPVPEGWEVKPLPEVIDFLEGPGIRNWQYTNSDEGTRFINIRCIKDRELDVLTANRVTDAEAYGKYKHFLLAPDDIVVSTSGTLGRFALVTNDDLPLMLNTSVIRMRPIEPFTTLPYLLEYIGSREFQLELETRASGSVQKNFGPMHLRQISLLVPPTMILKSHSSLVTPLLELGKALRAESRRLAALRDYLLPRLLSGRVRVNSVTCLPESMEVS